MGDIKKLTEEHYRIGFRAGVAIASLFWIVLLLLVMYYSYNEIMTTIEQCETHLKKAYEITSH